MVHSRTQSKDAAAMAAAGTSSGTSRPDTTTSDVVPGQTPEQIPLVGTQPGQALTTTEVHTMFNQQITLLQQVLASFTQSHTSTNKQLLATISTTEAKTIALENKISSLETTTVTESSTTSDLAQDLNNLRLASVDVDKVSNIEQDIAALQQAIPTKKKKLNVPNITDVTKLVLPTRPTFELASKTVKLKDLTNSLNTVKFESDDINHIKQNYALIRQAVDIGCGTSYLLPDIERMTEVPDFFKLLVPPQTNNFYFSILTSP